MFKILKTRCNHVYLTIFIATWTVVQSFVHVYGLMYIQWWRNCKIGKEHHQHRYLFILFSDTPCDNETHAYSTNVTKILSDGWIVRELDSFIFVYFILDALWIVTSVGLLTGACCLIREIWALVFYLPWIVVTAITLIFDIWCTIFFGSEIPTFGTFFEWFNFIGLTSQIKSLQNLEGDPIEIILGAVSIVMTFVSARAVIVWIINLIFLVIIFKITMRQYKTKQLPKKKETSRKIRPATRTNSQRIRDWHNFYDSGTNTSNEANSIYCDNSSTTNTVDAFNGTINKQVFFIAETYSQNYSTVELIEDSSTDLGIRRSEANSFDSTPVTQYVKEQEPNTSTAKNI